jgi:hypothetical protein
LVTVTRRLANDSNSLNADSHHGIAAALCIWRFGISHSAANLRDFALRAEISDAEKHVTFAEVRFDKSETARLAIAAVAVNFNRAFK